MEYGYSFFYYLNPQKRLPGNPTLILTPSGPEDEWSAVSSSSRGRLWQKMLSQLGQFVRLKPPELKKEEPDMRIGAFLNQGIVCKITWHLENLGLLQICRHVVASLKTSSNNLIL